MRFNPITNYKRKSTNMFINQEVRIRDKIITLRLTSNFSLMVKLNLKKNHSKMRFYVGSEFKWII
jgi:hypothetical protein